jgi:Cu2+-exporting ATPase
MCCAGCEAVVRAIGDAGLTDYYRFRTERPGRAEALVPEFLREARVYDDERVQAAYCTERGEDLRETSLLLEGIECAACLWLNERHLAALPGVARAEVNFATHRARVLWHPSRTRLSAILEAVRRIGYAAQPYDAGRAETVMEGERRRALRRLGLAGLLGMQVMMIAIALYAGDWYGMDPRFRDLLRLASLALSAPILAVCARPFFAGAWRDLRNRSPGMDVPVALGLSIAFAGSVVATVGGAGEVYFDSVAMFVFLLLLARFLELQARRRAVQTSESLLRARPAFAVRMSDGAGETVPVGDLRVGDRVIVRPGDVVPADGRVISGRSSVDESLLTGESRPLARRAGDALIGGSINYQSPLEMTVERVGTDTVLSQILDLVDRARAERPRIAALADRVAGWFVLGVLLVAAIVALAWWHLAPQSWLGVTVAVLVVTCPCALSLATPTTLTAALTALLGRGVVVTRGVALERLAEVDSFVFDKTGTLTEGRYRVEDVQLLGPVTREDALSIAAMVEHGSEHPLARALRATTAGSGHASRSELVNTPGAGVSATVDGHRYHLGTLEHACAAGIEPPAAVREALAAERRTVAVLGDEAGLLALFAFDDSVRADAGDAIARLRSSGVGISVLSGDHPGAVARTAAALGVDDFAGGLTPEGKVQRVRAMQAAGRVVAMAGDGVNDAPVLAAADVSMALDSGTDAARASADVVLVGASLAGLAEAVATARKARGIIRQNVAWAIGYNVIAVPAAAFGLVPPWLAAIGMSASSILVVANGLRAGHPHRGRRGRAEEATPRPERS